jgi:serine/threonine-protein phosphatase PP1 catalytic subunit
MHGGLSPKLECWEDILNIKRPVIFTNGSLACDLVWSDPNRGGLEFEVNYKRDRKNGIGYLFGVQQVADTCKALDIDLIVRGHQAPIPGYELFGEKLITIFSAPGYRTSADLETNFGASIYLCENGEVIITRIGVDNHVRLLRELQKLDKVGCFLSTFL